MKNIKNCKFISTQGILKTGDPISEGILTDGDAIREGVLGAGAPIKPANA